MYKLLILYPPPTDPEQFRDYYQRIHLPLGAKLPDLRARRYSLNVEGLNGPSPYFCVAEMEWDSKEAFLAALHSEEGKIAADDVAIYATGGVHFAHYEPTEG